MYRKIPLMWKALVSTVDFPIKTNPPTVLQLCNPTASSRVPECRSGFLGFGKQPSASSPTCRGRGFYSTAPFRVQGTWNGCENCAWAWLATWLKLGCELGFLALQYLLKKYLDPQATGKGFDDNNWFLSSLLFWICLDCLLFFAYIGGVGNGLIIPKFSWFWLNDINPLFVG
jgi:hypothetical protein